MKTAGWSVLIGLMGFCLLSVLTTKADDNPNEQPMTVNELRAVTKSVEWLKSKQYGDGSWGGAETQVTYTPEGQLHDYKIGITGLALYALLSCNVDPDDPVIKKGFNFIKKPAYATTYERGIGLVALEALADARARKKRATEVGLGAFLLPDEKELAKSFIKWLEAAQSIAGGWRYDPATPAPNDCTEDMSATQIVLLGLKSARRLQFPVNKKTFLKALIFVLLQQERIGPTVRKITPPIGTPSKKDETQSLQECKARGWGYINIPHADYDLGSPPPSNAKPLVEDTKVTGSMTAAGICSLIICKSELVRQPEFSKTLYQKTLDGINDGVCWLETHYTIKANPGGSGGWDYYYYLWGVERVGRMANLTHIGTNNWYKDGLHIMMVKQFKEGYWMNNKWWEQEADIIDTSFALLFLKKSTKIITD
jgi:hypothetical protein